MADISEDQRQTGQNRKWILHIDSFDLLDKTRVKEDVSLWNT